MADVEQQFEAAVNVISSMPKKGTYKPSYETMLTFYGFYKQAKEGPCNEPKPGFWDMVKKAKWDAWSSLGDISKAQAMKGYIDALKEVMETMPDTEEMADFSVVLKSFYELVYAPTGEEPPNILRIFKKPIPEKVEKCNGYTGNGTVVADQQDTEEDNSNPSEDLQSSAIHLNGLDAKEHNSLHVENGLLQQDNNIAFIESTENGVFNGSHISKDTRLSVEHSAGNLYIVEVSSQKKGFPKDTQDSNDVTNNTVANQNGDYSNGMESTHHVNSESDDSDEEFCDSIDPEYLSIMKTDANTLNNIPDGSQTHNYSGPINGSCDHDLSGCEANDEDLESNEQRLTSTPFHKKPVHVTFNTEEKKPNKKVKIGINGGILKVKQVGSGYGGGDAKQSSRQHMGRRYPETRQQASRLQDDTGISRSEFRSSGTSGQSDSDSDDTNLNCESCDSSGERDEINERIIAALERIQHDMNRVLRRLETMEDVMALRQEHSSSMYRPKRGERAPWWSQFLPSKTVAFLVLWPFVINLIFYYFRKRKGHNS